MADELKEHKLRILWSSNAPWSYSGYSVQTRDLLYRFMDAGFKNIAVSCFYGLEGGEIMVDGLRCYPKMGQAYGADACFHHQLDYKADAVITFQDVWPMDINILMKLKNWIPWVPVDHYPLPQAVYDRLKNAYRIVTFSRFGQKTIAESGLQSTLILEATNTDIFKPMDKQEQRKAIGIPPDIFLFGMVAANKDNPPRKSFQDCIDAFFRFQKNHPKSGMFFHTLLEQQGGFNISAYARFLGILDKIYFPPPYHMMFKSPHPVIARIMNTFDVLLNPSTSEGFGLPIIEAQSCGVPVIVNDWTSMPELVIPGKTGLITKIGFKRWTPLEAYVAHPDVNSLHDCMEKLYQMDREKMAKDCREHILKNYDINKRVKEEWIPFLEKLEKELIK